MSAPQNLPAYPVENATPAFEESVIIPQPLETAQLVEERVEAEFPEPSDFELEFPAEVAVEDSIPLQPGTPAAEPPAAVAPEPAPARAEIPIAESTPESSHSITPEPERPAAELFADKPKINSSRLFVPLTLLLLLAALGQSAYFMRTEIASHYPPAKPWLEQSCRWLGCTVELPRQEKLLAIEDSDLQDDPEHEGVLVLVSLINNLAPYAQAYPLLELTLTDTFDKPVLRRTFTPQEYLSKDVALAQGIAAGGELHVRLNLGVAGTKPAGYRLIIKY
jgi:hypothetical protein